MQHGVYTTVADGVIVSSRPLKAQPSQIIANVASTSRPNLYRKPIQLVTCPIYVSVLVDDTGNYQSTLDSILRTVNKRS
jgi:hypothetical protein